MVIQHTQTIFVNDPRGLPGNCLQVAMASLLDLPVEAVPHFALFEAPHAWFTVLQMWLEQQGLVVVPVSRVEVTKNCLAFGMSDRGVDHAVVWGINGLVHDPHPSRSGIDATQFWQIVEQPYWTPE